MRAFIFPVNEFVYAEKTVKLKGDILSTNLFTSLLACESLLLIWLQSDFEKS